MFSLFLCSLVAVDAATTSVIVDDRSISIEARRGDDLLNIGLEFCGAFKIAAGDLRDGRPRCATLIADELADALYCNESNSHTFRFYHGTYYFDSEEYELLRALFVRLGMVECLSGERIGRETIVWLLGHFQEDAPFYGHLTHEQFSNALPRPTELGDKDSLYRHLDRLRLRIGDRALRFVPRTWLPDQWKQFERNDEDDEIGGLWLRKDPHIELGGGIKLVRRWSELQGCEHCILQRYVDRPMLLDDPDAGVYDAKFSVGVYLSVSSVAPLAAWIHREMLVLLCTRPYQDDDVLSHLTNGLLNQRLAGEDYDASERVWTTDRLLAHLAKRGIDWKSIENQFREIAAVVLTASRQSLIEAYASAESPAKLFSHWRLDFLLDEDGRAWLLEVEIVPSTGTIGGVDEVLKTVVLRDLLSLNGIERVSSAKNDDISSPSVYEWLKGDECWTDTESRGKPPNRVCASPDLDDPRLYGDFADQAQAEIVERTLNARGDALQYDSASIEAIGRLEATRARAGGYRQLFPLPGDFEYFDGERGGSMRENGLPKIWRQIGATASDLVLDRWAESSTILPGENTERLSENFTGGYDLKAAERACRACVEKNNTFCATLDQFDDNSSDLYISGRCQRDVDECVHAPRGLVDGLALSECRIDEFALLETSRASSLKQHADGLERWCDKQAMRRGSDHRHSSVCGTRRRQSETAKPVVSAIDGCHEEESKSAIREALVRNTPLVLRGCAGGASWMPDYSSVSESKVVAMAFDSGKDEAQEISGEVVAFGDFLSFKGNDAPRDEKNRSLYLLFTDRHKVDGVVDASYLANPNSATVAVDEALSGLHALAVAQMDDVVPTLPPLDVAWTSLRYGQAYKYPTHIDCFENFILQLEGSKNVTFFLPETVKELRPDLNTKHWPRGDTQAMRRAKRKATTIILEPGDMAYIPLMWPHSVAAQEWSATANRYFWMSKDSSAWDNYIRARKSADWLSYELQESERVC